jgi:NAD(P)H-hydrate epimerase
MHIKPIEREYVKKLLHPRKPDMHKGNAGRVLIIAGSSGMAGAAVLSAGAALRSGAGLVYVSADEALWTIIQTHEPCAVCIGREFSRESDGDFLRKSNGNFLGKSKQSAKRLAPDISAYDAVALGPGLGRSAAARDITDFVLNNYKGKLIIDADALNIIAEARSKGEGGSYTGTQNAPLPQDLHAHSVSPPQTAPAPAVLTPHPGEAARLLGISVSEIQSDREAAAKNIARAYGAICLLKGHGTLVAPPSGEIKQNTTGNPGMATAGSGDALTGIIASFMAQGMSPMEAANCGAFIHGKAGDLAAAEIGEHGMTAQDIIKFVPTVIKYLINRIY